MKYFFTLISSLFFAHILPTQGAITSWKNEYATQIDDKKCIVTFEEGIDENVQYNLYRKVKGLRATQAHTPIPNTNTTILRLRGGKENYQQVIEALKKEKSVQQVTPFFKTPSGEELGILSEFFVRIKEKQDEDLLEAFFCGAGVCSIEPHQWLQQVYRIKTTKETSFTVLDMAISAHQSGLFDYAEPNYLLHPRVTAEVDDTYFGRQWPLLNTGGPLQWNGKPNADMNVVSAWDITTGSPDIRIAVLDSGVDTNHIDLVDNLVTGFDAIGENTKGYPTFNYEQDGHGTACAGILAAKGNNEEGVAGVAYDCSLVPVRLFYYLDTLMTVLPFSTSDWMATGISWAWQEGDADVLSNSWAFPQFLINLLPGDPAIVEQAITEAATKGRGGKGCLLFFSSGNDGLDPYWPAGIEGAISVNATSMCDERKSETSCDREDWAGNWGTGLEISGPGVKVPTTDATSREGYENGDYTFTFNGTSAACPNVAGVAALLLSANPSLSAWQAKDILFRTADRVGGYAYDSIGVHGTWSRELGYGRVNAAIALVEALTTVGGVEGNMHTNWSIDYYPNPVQEQLHIKIMGLPSNDWLRISIYTINGQQVYQEQFNNLQLSSKQLISIPFNDLALKSGTYLVTIASANQTDHHKCMFIHD